MNADLNLNRHSIINLSAPTAADDAVTRQLADDTYLKRDGSSAVAGVVEISNNRLMNLGDPLGERDAINLRYLGGFLKLYGSTAMASVLNLGGHVITNVGQQVSPADVVSKGYANNVVGSTHLDMRGHKIVNLKEPMARSDAVARSFIESIFNDGLDMRGNQ
jgi:hypothetical protein